MPASLAINGSFEPVTSKENVSNRLGKGTSKGITTDVYVNGPTNPNQTALNSKHLAALEDTRIGEDRHFLP